MKIVKVVDHVLVQYSYGGAHQVDKDGNQIPLGEISGAQIGEKEYIVDDGGKVIGEANTPINKVVRAITLDEAKALFGKQAGELIAQADAARREVETHKAALKKADEDVAEARRQQRRAENMLSGKSADLLAAQAVIARQSGRIEKLRDAVLRADAKRDALREDEA